MGRWPASGCGVTPVATTGSPDRSCHSWCATTCVRTCAICNAASPGSSLKRRDQALDALVDRPERVLAQHGALRLVVELEVHPVHGEVAAGRLGGRDEVAAQLGPGRLRRGVLGGLDLAVIGHPVDKAL